MSGQKRFAKRVKSEKRKVIYLINYERRVTMTKIVKKSLLAVLALLFVMVCLVAGVSSAKAAITDLSANGKKFYDAVEAFRGETVDEELLVSDPVKAAAFAGNTGCAIYLFTQNGLTEGDKALLAEEGTIDLYNDLYEVFSEAYQVRLAISGLFRLANTDVDYVMYSENAEVEAIEAQFDALSDNEKAFVDNNTFNHENLIGARAKLNEKKARIDAAFAAINAIKYYNAEGKTMDSGLTTGEVVLASKETIDAAKTALDKIFGKDIFDESIPDAEREFITNLSIYSDAVTDYEAWIAVVADAENAISNIKVKYGEKYYTLRDEINAANSKYTALLDTYKRMDNTGRMNFNDLQSLVSATAKEKLQEMTDTISEIEAAIATVKTEIDKIPALEELKYTDAHNTLIKNAEELFAGLDADIIENDEAVYGGDDTRTYIVDNYAAMADTRDKWKEWDASVKNLVSKIEYFIANYGAGEFNAVEALNEVQTTLNTFTAEQKNVFYATEVEFDGEMKTCQYVMGFYQQEVEEINNAVMPVINLINAIPAEATVSEAYINALEAANNAYEALPAGYKTPINYVTNVEKLDAANRAYEAISQDITAWRNAVAAVKDLAIDTSNMGKVDDMVAAFDTISEAARTLIVNGTVYAEEYGVHTAKITEKTTLLADIKNLALSMSRLSTEKPAPNAEALEAFNAAYNAVKESFNDLSKIDQEWLKANETDLVGEEGSMTYAAAYVHYQSGLDVVAAVAVEVAINDIAPIPVTLQSKTSLEAAEAAYAGLSPEQIKLVNNEIYGKMTAARTAFDDLTAGLDAWIESVDDLLGTLAIEDLWNVDLGVVDDLEAAYVLYDADEQAYVAEGKNLLDDIKAKSDERIADLNTRIANIPVTLGEDDIVTLNAIKSDYEKLHATQQAGVNYSAFSAAYNKVIFATYFDRAVNAIKTQVSNGVFTLEDKITLDVLRSIYTSASAELQGLVETAAELDALEAAFADKTLIDLASSVEDIKALIEALGDDITDLNELIGGVESKVETLKSDYEAKVADYNAKIEALQNALATVNGNIAAIQSQIETLTSEFNATKADFESEIAALNTSLTALENKLTNAINGAKNELEGKITALDEKLTNALNSAVENLEGLIDGLDDKLDEEIANLTDSLTASIASVEGELDGKITALKTKTEKDIAALKAELEEKIKSELDTLETSLKAYADTADAKLKTELTETIDSLQKKLVVLAVVGLILAAALAVCVVVLFVKTKKAN